MTAATAGMGSQEIITVAKPLGIAVHDHITSAGMGMRA